MVKDGDDNLPLWNLGAKHTRLSLVQDLMPKAEQHTLRNISATSMTYSDPFPLTKFSALRLPALPDLCHEYFTAEPTTKCRRAQTCQRGDNTRVRLPYVNNKRRTTRPSRDEKEQQVGGGIIFYEDEWTVAKLSGGDFQPQVHGAPILHHYWNISGHDRQRIISCPQHNLAMNNGMDGEMDVVKWRVPRTKETSKAKKTPKSRTFVPQEKIAPGVVANASVSSVNLLERIK